MTADGGEHGHHHEHHGPGLYDIETALVDLARARRRRDPLTRESATIADRFAESIIRHFSSEETESVGRTLVLAASQMGGLIEMYADAAGPADAHTLPTVMTNVVAFAGQRLVLDARAADGQAPS